MRTASRLLLAVLCLFYGAPEVAAQTGCETETASFPYMLAEVCSLQDTAFTYDNIATSQFMPFSITSCGGSIFGNRCNQSVNYRVEATSDTTTGASYILTGNSGSIPIELAFTSDGGISETLLPDTPSGIFTGSVNTASVSLSLQRFATDPSLLPDTYSGQFEFTLQQEEYCRNFFVTICNQTPPISVAFQVDVTVEPMIRIRGLADRVINANPTGVTEDQQDFCVFSQGGAPFKLTADSQTGDGVFELNGNIDQIEYETWIQNLAQGSMEQLTEGQASGQSWPGRLYENCSAGGNNMRITIRIQPAALANAVGTSYSDTLTLTVRVE